MERMLDVLICTYGLDGIKRVARMNLPKVKGVMYVVSWQTAGISGDVPDELCRDDVEVFQTATRGLSVNRNEALSHSKGEICLIADDDLIYEPSQLEAVIRTFNEHPEVDLATFRYEGEDRKYYPGTIADISRMMPKGYWVSSFEIAFRRRSVAGKVKFNENFGIGAPVFGAGEESVFLTDCRRAGLICRFFPITITKHIGLTTGLRNMSRWVVMSTGAYVRYEYGWKGFPRLLLFAWRSWRNGRCGLISGAYYVARGFFIQPRYF